MTQQRSDAQRSGGEASSEAGGAAAGGDWLTPGKLSRRCALAPTARLIPRRPCAGDGPAMSRIHRDPVTNRADPRGHDPDLDTAEPIIVARGGPVLETPASPSRR